MGVMKFRLPSEDLVRKPPDYRKAYITGLDRTPARVGVELRNGLMTCLRETTESGRLFVPWPIDGYGTPIVGTATLAERPTPYALAVELARGKLNDVRNQLADWTQMGLRSTPELTRAARSRAARVHPSGHVHRESGEELCRRPILAPFRRTRGRIAHGSLHESGAPEPATGHFQAPDSSRLRVDLRPPQRADHSRMAAHV